MNSIVENTLEPSKNHFSLTVFLCVNKITYEHITYLCDYSNLQILFSASVLDKIN